MDPAIFFWIFVTVSGGRHHHAHFIDRGPWLRRGKSQRSPKSQRLKQTRTQRPTPFLSIPPRKLCVYTCACTYVCVSGHKFPHVPQSCPPVVLGYCVYRLVHWACLFQEVPPCRSGEKREIGEWGGSYTYIFVLPTDFSCCVLSSV